MFINMLGTWIRGFLSIVVLTVGVLLIKEWVDRLPRETTEAVGSQVVRRPLVAFPDRLRAWDPADRSKWLLISGALLLLFSIGGRWVTPVLWKRGERPGRRPEPRIERVKTRHGYELNVEIHGPPTGHPLVLVHGLGSNRTQWREVIEDLGDRFRIFAFDLLGHGRSDHVARAEHTLEAAARDLDDVLGLAEGEPILLAGHSMGAMIALTWCLGHSRRQARLAGLVLIHTTPQNPFETMAPVALHRALQKPVHEPVLRLTPALAWVVRAMNALDYMNGTTHWANDRQMFGGSETKDQLERSARLQATMDPGAVARFALSMTRFDVRSKLSKLEVPALVVAAEKDGVTIVKASRDLARRLPNAELVVLPKTRHMGFMERRSEFVKAIERFQQKMGKHRDEGRAARALGQ